MDQVNSSKTRGWVFFIGLVLFLIGIYASVRTVVNLVAFQKYPQGGVLSINFPGVQPIYPSIGQTEESCDISYDPNAPSIMVEGQKKGCKLSVKQARQDAKVADISNSLFYLFIGGSILVLHKRLL